MRAAICIMVGFLMVLARELQLQQMYPGENLTRFKDYWPGGATGDIGLLLLIIGCLATVL